MSFTLFSFYNRVIVLYYIKREKEEEYGEALGGNETGEYTYGSIYRKSVGTGR